MSQRLRLSRIPGLPVVDTHIARQAGVVSDVLLDVQAGRVAVLNVKHGDGWVVQRIPAAYIYRLGPRTVLVTDTVAIDLGPPAADQPWFPIQSLIGLQVLSEGGDMIGEITDAELDDRTLYVKSYLLHTVSSAWRRRGRIQPDEVVSCSPELMLIKERKK